jgi:hypothetical protein
VNFPDNAEAIPKKDPRGAKVFLRKTTWEEHICSNHPEMYNCLEEVLHTLMHPEKIYSYRDHRFSFRFSRKKGSFIMIIYKISGTLGWVKTAYTVQNPYGEVEGYNRVWPIGKI